ncbi:MAG: PQQ-binding-like beta-propeller repeat protein [Myxococcota bacterium]
MHPLVRGGSPLVFAVHAVLAMAATILATLPSPSAQAQPQPFQARQPLFSVGWRMPLVDPPSVDWKPRERAGVVVSPKGGLLFAGSATGVSALQTDDGKRLWHHKTTESVESRPALWNGVVYAATLSGAVWALDARSGEPVWEAPTKLDAAVQAPIAADDKQIYVAVAPSSLVALDRKTGKPAWRYNDETVREFLITGQSGALVVGQQLWFGTASGKLVALSTRDGGVNWQVSLDRPDHGPYADIDTTPVYVSRPEAKDRPGDWVLAASYNGGLFAVSAVDGAAIWQYPVEALGQPIVAGGLVYAVSSNGELHILDLATGKPMITRKLDGSPSGTLAVLSSGLLLVPGELGLDAVSPRTGQASARAMTETGFSAAPTVVGDRVFAVSNGGVLYALSLR